MLLLCLCALSAGRCAVPDGVRVNGISLVPVRPVAEWLGMKVRFDRPAGAIILAKGKLDARLTLGSADAMVDNATVTLAYPVYQRGAETYAPARLFAALDARVGWNAQERAVLITPPSGNMLAIPVWEEKILYRSDLGDHRGNAVICSMDPDGGNARALTEAAYDCGPIAVSPDGSTVAFISTRDNHRGIYAMRPNGTEQRLLFASDTARSPCYSADGKYLYYLTELGLGRLDADGQHQQGTPWFKLTKATWHTDAGEGPTSLAALRDGRMLVSVRYHGKDWDRIELYLADYDQRAMTPYLHEGAELFNPALNGDGTLLAAQRFTAASEKSTAARLDLCVMRADGAEARAVTGEGDEPSFSPDGMCLAFTRGMDIYSINLDGAGLCRLTDTHAWESNPCWVLVR